MPLILEERQPTPAKPAKKSIFKGITIAVLLHLIVVVAYLYATGNIGGRVESIVPEVSSTPIQPKSTVVAAKPPYVTPKTTDSNHVYGWSDKDGVEHFANSEPPPEARDVQKQIEIKPVEKDIHLPVYDDKSANPTVAAKAKKAESLSPVDDDKKAKPIIAAKTVKPESLPVSVSAQRIPEAWVAREKARLEKDLEYYENRYRRREQTVISLAEKEDLLRPINEIKDKLQRLQESPERYFGLMEK